MDNRHTDYNGLDGMRFRSIASHIVQQNWVAVFIDFLIVIVGVVIGIQISNLNDARQGEYERQQMVDALVTSLSDAVLLPPETPALAEGSTADEIRSVREASNAALKTGDMETFVHSLDADYVGTGGSGGHLRSREELARRIGKRIDETPGLHYVRTPSELVVSQDKTRAFESGRWVEVLPSGDQQLLGRYTAHWVHRESRWMIHAEVFVTLSSALQQ